MKQTQLLQMILASYPVLLGPHKYILPCQQSSDVLAHSVFYNKNIIVRAAYKQQKSITYIAGRFRVHADLLLCVSSHGRGQKPSRMPITRVLIPLTGLPCFDLITSQEITTQHLHIKGKDCITWILERHKHLVDRTRLFFLMF